MNSTMERANAEDEEPGHDVQRVWGPDDELNVERPESVKGDSKVGLSLGRLLRTEYSVW